MSRSLTFDDGAGFTFTASRDWDSPVRITKFDGWTDGADVRRVWTETELGEISSELYRLGRKMTVAGRWQFQDPGEMIRTAHLMSGVFPNGQVGSGTITVGDEGGDWISEGLVLDGTVKVTYDIASCVLRFEIPVRNPNPVIYGPLQHGLITPKGQYDGLEFLLFDEDSTGETTGFLEYGTPDPPQIQLQNDGNETAYPVIVVHGDWPSGFRLRFMVNGARPPATARALAVSSYDPGDTSGQIAQVVRQRALGLGGSDTIEYVEAVYPQSPVTIDTAGSIVVNGYDRTSSLVQRNWIGVPPKGTMNLELTPLSAGQGSGWADVTMRSAYI